MPAIWKFTLINLWEAKYVLLKTRIVVKETA